MTLRHLPRPSVRVVALAAIAVVIAGAALTSRGSQPTTANPLYGNVKLNPTSKFIIEGHEFGVATDMTTCTYGTIIPTSSGNYYCQLGAYDVNINYNPAMFQVVTSTGTSTGANTTLTLKDTTRTATAVIKTGITTSTTATDLVHTGAGFTGTAVGALITAANGQTMTVTSVPNGDTLRGSGGWSGGGTGPGADVSYAVGNNPLRWRANQWAGSSVTITGGTAAGQTRIITSNTSDTLNLAKAWDPFPAVVPDATSTYLIGGMTNGAFLGSNNGILPIIPNSGRPVSCPVGPAYGVGWAELHCITLGDPSVKGAYGNGAAGSPGGTLTNLTLRAIGRGVWPRVPAAFTFTLPPAVNGTRVIKVDSLDIPADIYQTGTRRVVLCPDPNGNGLVNSTDMLMQAQAFNKKGPLWQGAPYPGYPAPQAGYTLAKDPSEDGNINSTDMLIAAGVFNLKCIQP
ncbi:MAG: hypothetical protein HY874_11755 [Chloroflexi bacterium]|nr:hypothetical protein [Chloroflexota bacterium]